MITSRLGGLRSGPRSSAGGWSGSLLSRRHNQANVSQARSIPTFGRQVASSRDEPVPLECRTWIDLVGLHLVMYQHALVTFHRPTVALCVLTCENEDARWVP